MNREDIIKLAREANVPYDPWPNSEYNKNLERFAALVAAHIRETEFKPDWNNYRQGVADGAAAERTEMAKHCAEITRAAVTKAVDGAIALEREECAKVCDAKYEEYPDEKNDLAFALSAKELAACIRARGQSCNQ